MRIEQPFAQRQVMPDRFWVWGKDDAEALLKLNKEIFDKLSHTIGQSFWATAVLRRLWKEAIQSIAILLLTQAFR